MNNENKNHNCNCGENCECNEHEHNHAMFIELEDEQGNVVKCEVVDGFEYKGSEYALVENRETEISYLFKVTGDDEEVAELKPLNDEEFEDVKNYYESLLEE